MSATKKISMLELILIFLVILIFGYLVFSLISQIYSLNLELKNLISLVQSLQENQFDLKNQLSTKDQEIKLLENTIHNIKMSSFSTLNDDQNLELLKKEIAKNSNHVTFQFILKTGGVVLSAFLILKFIKNFI